MPPQVDLDLPKVKSEL